MSWQTESAAEAQASSAPSSAMAAARISERHVGAAGGGLEGPSVAGVAGVDDGLVVRARRALLGEGGGVIRLAQELRPVAERAVADDEAGAAGRQVAPVRAGQAADDDAGAALVLGASPARTAL